MPFTLAHPAAVLPLLRRPFSGLALVCGAMAPDIPYYIRATPLPVTAQSWYEPFTNATTSHSPAGMLPVTLPLALVLYLILLAATPPAVWLVGDRAPADARRTAGAVPDRADGAAHRGWTRWAWVPVSLLIGVLTHLVWDSFADPDGILAARFDGLNATAFGDLTWVRLLQHLSTAIGLIVLAVVLWRRRGRLAGQDAASRRRTLWALGGLLAVGLAGAVVSVVATLDFSAPPSTRDRIEHILAAAAMGGGAAVAVAVVLATACWWGWRLRVTHQAP